MSKDFLLKVATVLETAADVIDAQEAEKVAAAANVRNEAVKAAAAKYASLTGEDLPEEELKKLAASGDALSTFTRLLEKTASGPVESLGRSSEHPSDRPVPTTKKEAAQQAWDRFGTFINS